MNKSKAKSWGKRFIGMSLIAAVVLSPSAALASANTKPPEENVTVLSLQANPRFKYLTNVFSGLSIDKDRIYYCQASCTIFKDYDVDLTVTLQESTDKIRWSDVESWTEHFSETGALNMQKLYYRAYDAKYYRVKTTAEVLSSSGSVLETADCLSPISR